MLDPPGTSHDRSMPIACDAVLLRTLNSLVFVTGAHLVRRGASHAVDVEPALLARDSGLLNSIDGRFTVLWSAGNARVVHYFCSLCS